MPADLFCYYNGSDYVIAHSPEDASAVWAATIGAPRDDEEYPWELLNPERTLNASLDDDAGHARKQTIAAWIAELGRCFFCSEDY